jgi:hypothetical protein
MQATPAVVKRSPYRAERRIAWISDAIACLYFAWLCFVLVRHTSAFAGAFEGLGAEIPASTAFLVRHYQWLYPVFLGGAGLFVLSKERWLRDARVSTAVTFTTALLVQAVSDHCREMTISPLLDLMRKLS